MVSKPFLNKNHEDDELEYMADPANKRFKISFMNFCFYLNHSFV